MRRGEHGFVAVVRLNGDSMSHSINVYRLSDQSAAGHEEDPYASLTYNAFYEKAHEIYDVLGARRFYAGVSGNGKGCKVSKRKILAALDHFCQRRLAGENVFYELEFLAGILAFWWSDARSVYVIFGEACQSAVRFAPSLTVAPPSSFLPALLYASSRSRRPAPRGRLAVVAHPPPARTLSHAPAHPGPA